MPSVITAKEVEDLIAKGGDPKSLPADAILTPSAKDAIRDFANSHRGSASASMGSPAPAKPLNSKSPKAELEAYFSSPVVHALKEQLCEIGRRYSNRREISSESARVGETTASAPSRPRRAGPRPREMRAVRSAAERTIGGRSDAINAPTPRGRWRIRVPAPAPSPGY